MKGFILGVIVTLLIIAVSGYVYFSQGYAPVATSAKPMPFEKKLAHMALNALIDREAPKSAPFQPTEANYVAGAHDYVEHCAVCHGVPNQAQTAISKGEFPKPPMLFKGKGVTDDEPNESYWKIANGIRLTGMPAFDQSLSTTQMWQIAFVVAHADKLPASAMAVLSGPASVATQPVSPAVQPLK